MAWHHHFTSVVEDVCLWVDSTDYQLNGKAKMSCRRSYKKNSPAQHFMVIQDMSGRIKKAWGGYSPKIHNSQFLKVQQDTIETNFTRATIISNGHFSWGNALDGVKFIIPTTQRAGDPDTMEGTQQLTEQEKQDNKLIHSTRACVEGPFSRMKESFEALKGPFADGEEQQTCLFWLAVGVHNCRS
jgi:hypothetical protein